MKFAFIEAEKAYFPVAVLCALLGVTRQGYYAYRSRPPSPRAISEKELQARVLALHEESRGTYGSPRILEGLKAAGLKVGKRRVERIMRGLGIFGRPPARKRLTTQANPAHQHHENKLNRDFTASRPNERWVTDITYVWTAEGWAYLAVILDLYSRAVVGWALDNTLETRLVVNALDAAVVGSAGRLEACCITPIAVVSTRATTTRSACTSSASSLA